MAKHNLMSAISGLGETGEDHEKAKTHEKSKEKTKKKPKVVNLGKAGSFKINHPGGLHTATHTPQGEKIPESKIEAASHSKDAHVRRMAASAKGFEAMHHGGKK